MQLQSNCKHLNLRGKTILEEQNKIIQYLLNTKNPYQIKVGEMTVEMEYSDTNKTFDECMVNILKQKYKKG